MTGNLRPLARRASGAALAAAIAFFGSAAQADGDGLA